MKSSRNCDVKRPSGMNNNQKLIKVASEGFKFQHQNKHNSLVNKCQELNFRERKNLLVT